MEPMGRQGKACRMSSIVQITFRKGSDKTHVAPSEIFIHADATDEDEMWAPTSMDCKARQGNRLDGHPQTGAA